MALGIGREMELFDRLMELEPQERARALGELATDEESRARLADLVRAAGDAEIELERSVAGAMRLWGQSGVLEAGTDIGRFHLVRELGRGGMGEVWLVEFSEEGLARRGALKVLRRQLSEAGQLGLWDRERRLLARLSHPYVAGMIESGTLAGGQQYLLMEYVEGRRLDEAAAEMGIQERVEILGKVCDAVAAAHRQMVVHRDLKPGNILITTDGLPKLVDFGIGQALDVDAALLGAGTRAYASPEQLAGQEATALTDVFALGRILEKLAGHGGKEMEAIVRKATAVSPEQRYESAGELGKESRRWLERRPVAAYGSGWRYGVRCLARRQPWLTAGLGLALALLMVAAGIAVQQYARAQQRASELRSMAGVAIFELDEEVRKLPGSLKARQMLLETATRYLANLEAAARDDRSLRAELADAYQKTSVLLFTFGAQSLDRFGDSMALAEKAYRLREELGQFESRDSKTRKSYAAAARDYAEKLRLKRRLEEADRVFARAQEHGRRWAQEAPESWEALEHLLYFENAVTRRLRLQGRDAAIANQRQVVARVAEMRRLGAPAKNYWRMEAEQQRLMAGLMLGGDDAKSPPDFVKAMNASVKAAEELYRVEATPLSTRLLLVIYGEYAIQTVEMGVPVVEELERVIARSAEILDSPDLPDRSAGYWEDQRLELEMSRAWAALARQDWAEAKKRFAICRQKLEEAGRARPGAFLLAMRAAQVAEAEQKYLRGR